MEDEILISREDFQCSGQSFVGEVPEWRLQEWEREKEDNELRVEKLELEERILEMSEQAQELEFKLVTDLEKLFGWLTEKKWEFQDIIDRFHEYVNSRGKN